MATNSFGARATLRVGDRSYEVYRLDALEKAGFALGRLPYALKILLENLLRTEDGTQVRREDVDAVEAQAATSISTGSRALEWRASRTARAP